MRNHDMPVHGKFILFSMHLGEIINRVFHLPIKPTNELRKQHILDFYNY